MSPNATSLHQVIAEQKTNDETYYQYLGPVISQGMTYRKSHQWNICKRFCYNQTNPKFYPYCDLHKPYVAGPLSSFCANFSFPIIKSTTLNNKT